MESFIFFGENFEIEKSYYNYMWKTDSKTVIRLLTCKILEMI